MLRSQSTGLLVVPVVLRAEPLTIRPWIYGTGSQSGYGRQKQHQSSKLDLHKTVLFDKAYN